jgi:hypothetical protein
MTRLTVNRAKAVKAPGTYTINGLRLIVAEKGARHWELRYQGHRRVHYIGLGSVDSVSLEA